MNERRAVFFSSSSFPFGCRLTGGTLAFMALSSLIILLFLYRWACAGHVLLSLCSNPRRVWAARCSAAAAG